MLLAVKRNNKINNKQLLNQILLDLIIGRIINKRIIINKNQKISFQIGELCHNQFKKNKIFV